MKDNVLTAVLVAVLFASAVAATWLSVRWFFSVRELQKLQAQAVQINQTRNALQMLAAEAVEYSKRNPALDPVLHEFNLKPKPGATNPPAVPAGNP